MREQSPPSLYQSADKALIFLENAAAILAGVMVFVAMLLTSLDVLMRYFFSSPLTFAYHLTEFYLMVGMMVLPFAWGFRTGGYIRVMAIAGKLPAALSSLLLRLGLLVSLVYSGWLTWLSVGKTWEHYVRGDVQMGVIDWPVWLSWLSIPVGLGLLTARLVMVAIGPKETLNVVAQMSEDIA